MTLPLGCPQTEEEGTGGHTYTAALVRSEGDSNAGVLDVIEDQRVRCGA